LEHFNAPDTAAFLRLGSLLEIKIEDDPTEVSQEPKQSKKSKYQHLLKNPDVNRWYRNLMRGSPITADERLRRLGWLCDRFQTTPQALAKMSKKQAGDFLLDVATDLEDGKLRSSYIANIIKAAKSWLKFNGKKPDVEIKFARETGKYAQEKPPTNNELRRILDAADMRQKVAISLMAFAGFRDQTLGNYKGVDGLKIADFPEMTINDGRVEFRKTPTIVRCRSPVSKIGYEYGFNYEECA
jgi:integrase